MLCPNELPPSVTLIEAAQHSSFAPKRREMMKDRNFSTAFTIDQTPEEAFAAINNVREWWAGKPGIEGSTDKLGDEFTYAYEPHHYSKQKVTELIPGKKVVWLVLESQLNFVKDKSEWNSTKVTFEIAKKGDKTEVRFTHQGLVPDYECYGACSNAWGSIINRSLRSLITTGVAEKSSLSGRARSNPVGG
jgi:Activator of Hsp90 ATPase homolog 1-like protein